MLYFKISTIKKQRLKEKKYLSIYWDYSNEVIYMHI